MNLGLTLLYNLLVFTLIRLSSFYQVWDTVLDIKVLERRTSEGLHSSFYELLDLYLFLLSEMEYAGWVSKSLQEVLSARAPQEISLYLFVNKE